MSLPLLDIPAEARGKSEARRLTEFCAKHGIWTNRSPDADEPWLAMAWREIARRMDAKCDGSEASCFELYGGYCSWADDVGLLVTGTGRLSVVRALAANLSLEGCP